MRARIKEATDTAFVLACCLAAERSPYAADAAKVHALLHELSTQFGDELELLPGLRDDRLEDEATDAFYAQVDEVGA